MCSVICCWVNLISVSLHFKGMYCFLLQGMRSPRWPDTRDRWRYIGLLARKEHQADDGRHRQWLVIKSYLNPLLTYCLELGLFNILTIYIIYSPCLSPVGVLLLGHISITALFGVPKYTPGTTHCSKFQQLGHYKHTYPLVSRI